MIDKLSPVTNVILVEDSVEGGDFRINLGKTTERKVSPRIRLT